MEEMPVKEKIMVEREYNVAWRSRFLKEIKKGRDNGHSIFYTHETFLKCHPSFKIRKMDCRSSHKVPIILIIY